MAKKTGALAEEGDLKDSKMTMEALVEQDEYVENGGSSCATTG